MSHGNVCIQPLHFLLGERCIGWLGNNVVQFTSTEVKVSAAKLHLDSMVPIIAPSRLLLQHMFSALRCHNYGINNPPAY